MHLLSEAWLSGRKGSAWVGVGGGGRKRGWEGSKRRALGFPGGAVVKNPPANAGDTGSSPGPGRFHMSWSS